MSELKRIDQVLAHLTWQQARGGMTYKKAVDIETLISVFERIRNAKLVVENRTSPSDTPTASETVLDVFLRGLST